MLELQNALKLNQEFKSCLKRTQLNMSEYDKKWKSLLSGKVMYIINKIKQNGMMNESMFSTYIQHASVLSKIFPSKREVLIYPDGRRMRVNKIMILTDDNLKVGEYKIDSGSSFVTLPSKEITETYFTDKSVIFQIFSLLTRDEIISVAKEILEIKKKTENKEELFYKNKIISSKNSIIAMLNLSNFNEKIQVDGSSNYCKFQEMDFKDVLKASRASDKELHNVEKWLTEKECPYSTLIQLIKNDIKEKKEHFDLDEDSVVFHLSNRFNILNYSAQ